jgi:hypothetical protein
MATDAKLGFLLARGDVGGRGRRVPRRNHEQRESGGETRETAHDRHSHS